MKPTYRLILLIAASSTTQAAAQLVHELPPAGHNHLQFVAEQLIVAGEDHLKLWDPGSGKELLHLTSSDIDDKSIVTGSGFANSEEIRFIEIDPDSNAVLRKFDREGQELRSLPVLPGEWVMFATWSSDGKVLALACSKNYKQRVVILDADSLKQRGTADLEATSMALSADGSRLAVARPGGKDAISMLDGATAEVLATTGGFATNVGVVAISPDGRSVVSAGTVGGKEGVTFWEARSLRPRRGYQLTDEQLGEGSSQSGYASLSFWPDGKLVAIGRRHATCIVDSETRTVVAELRGREWARPLAISPDGEFVGSIQRSGKVAVWRWKDFTRRAPPVLTIKSHPPGDYRPRLSYSPSGEYLAISSACRPQGSNVGIVGSIVSSVEKTIDDSGPSEPQPLLVMLVDPETGQLRGQLPVNHLAPGTVGDKFRKTLSYADYLTFMEFSPDGQRLVAATNRGQLLSWVGQTLVGGWDNAPAGVAFTADGERLAVSNTNGLEILDLRNGKTKNLNGDVYSHSSVEFVPSEQQVLLGMSIYDAHSGEALFTGDIEGESVGDYEDVTCSADGKYAYAHRPYKGRVVRWDLEEGTFESPYLVHSEESWLRTTDIALSPAGNVLATATVDAAIRLWDAASGQLLVTLEGHEAQVGAIDFSPDGERLASIGSDGTTRFWDVAAYTQPGSVSDRQAAVAAPPTTKEFRASNGGLVRVIFDRAASDDDVQSAVAEAVEQLQAK